MSTTNGSHRLDRSGSLPGIRTPPTPILSKRKRHINSDSDNGGQPKRPRLTTEVRGVVAPMQRSASPPSTFLLDGTRGTLLRCGRRRTFPCPRAASRLSARAERYIPIVPVPTGRGGNSPILSAFRSGHASEIRLTQQVRHHVSYGALHRYIYHHSCQAPPQLSSTSARPGLSGCLPCSARQAGIYSCQRYTRHSFPGRSHPDRFWYYQQVGSDFHLSA